MAAAIDGRVVVIGGESARKQAHVEVEALDLGRGVWAAWPPLDGGRHATQAVLHDGSIYLQAGSVTRGGTETDSLTRFRFRG